MGSGNSLNDCFSKIMGLKSLHRSRGRLRSTIAERASFSCDGSVFYHALVALGAPAVRAVEEILVVLWNHGPVLAAVDARAFRTIERREQPLHRVKGGGIRLHQGCLDRLRLLV